MTYRKVHILEIKEILLRISKGQSLVRILCLATVDTTKRWKYSMRVDHLSYSSLKFIWGKGYSVCGII